MTRITLSALALGLVLTAAGCGGTGQQTVTGKVTFDGKPLEEGRITFRQVDGEKRAYSAPITNGSYTIQCDPGKMAVEIIASRLIPGKFDTSNGTKEPVGEMYIPAMYNSATTLTADVSSSNRNIPFELKSKG
jgi:hypothetical protein